MAQPALHAGPSLDFANDCCVVADARVEAEVAAVDVTETDWADVVRSDPVGQKLHRFDGIVGHAERSSEDIGAAARKRAERGVGSRHTSGHLVERAIAAEAD